MRGREVYIKWFSCLQMALKVLIYFSKFCLVSRERSKEIRFVFFIFLLLSWFCTIVHAEHTASQGQTRLSDCMTGVFVTDAGSQTQSQCCVLEIYNQNQWGKVHFWVSDNIDLEAKVACRQLGCNSDNGFGRQEALAGTTNVAGTGILWQYNVECTGNEDSIVQCPQRPGYPEWTKPGDWNYDDWQDGVGVCCSDVEILNNAGLGGCPCKAGFYANIHNPHTYDNFYECELCPTGKTSFDDAKSIDECFCSPGYEDDNGKCKECGAGKYSNGLDCINCEPGKYTSSNASSTCTICEKGKYTGISESTACLSCPKGKYSNSQTCLDSSPENAGSCGSYTTCWESRCANEEEDCKSCAPNEYCSGGCEFCLACPDGEQPDTEQSACEQCDVGKYSSSVTNGLCASCPEHHFSDQQGMSTCTACDSGKTNNTDSTECTSCDDVDGFFKAHPDSGTKDFLPSGEGCRFCDFGKYMDMRKVDRGVDRWDACTDCPQGKFSNTPGATQCEMCPPCPDQHYRTGCTKLGEIGFCMPCDSCEDGQVRVDCINRAGHSEAKGACISTELVSGSAMCRQPLEGSVDNELTLSPGLGGFSFEQVFGADEEHVEFQCSRSCDGQPRFLNDGEDTDTSTYTLDPSSTLLHKPTSNGFQGRLDTRYCTGPHACRTLSCSAKMNSDEEYAETYQMPWACPLIIEEDDSSEVVTQKVGETCQRCDECGTLPSSSERPADFGRGCAVECTRVAGCDLGEIFDWTEPNKLYKCKKCSDLRDPRLCSSTAYNTLNLATTDISGNRPKLEFTDCVPKEEQGEDGVVTPTYGNCKLWEQPTTTCTDGQYDAGRDGCLVCIPRPGPTIPVSAQYWHIQEMSHGFILTLKKLYCQIETVEDKTGMFDNGALAVHECEDIECADFEIPLGCSLPHSARCVRSHPPQRQDQFSVDFVPVHANVLEPLLLNPGEAQHYASFENLLVNTAADNMHQHQCVWNAVDVRDNDMNPAGISHSFLRPATVYGFLEAKGSKFCHTWTRKLGQKYPMLPLQNAILVSGDTTGSRHVYVNTPARVALYWQENQQHGYTGAGFPGDTDIEVVADIQRLSRPSETPNAFRTPTDLDTFLILDMHGARNAALAVLLPVDRALENTDWVPQWAFSAYVRESTVLEDLERYSFEIPFEAHFEFENHNTSKKVLDESLLQNPLKDLPAITLRNFNPLPQTPQDWHSVADGQRFSQKPARFKTSNGNNYSSYVVQRQLKVPMNDSVRELALRYPATYVGDAEAEMHGALLVRHILDNVTSGSVSSLILGHDEHDAGSFLFSKGNTVCKFTLGAFIDLFTVPYPEFIFSISQISNSILVMGIVDRSTLHDRFVFWDTKNSTAVDTLKIDTNQRIIRLAADPTKEELNLFALTTYEGVVDVYAFDKFRGDNASSQSVTFANGMFTTILNSKDVSVDINMLRLTTVLATKNSHVLAALPYLISNTETGIPDMAHLTLRVFTYNVSDTESTTTLETKYGIDVPVPTWKKALDAKHGGMLSYAWFEDAVLLGFAGHLIRVDLKRGHLEAIQSPLEDTHFVQLRGAFITFDVPPFNTNNVVFNKQCHEGFLRTTSSFNHSIQSTLTTSRACHQNCIETLSCTAFHYNDRCTLLGHNNLISDNTTSTICMKVTTTSQTFISSNLQEYLRPLFTRVSVLGIVHDVAPLSNESGIIGRYAFCMDNEICDLTYEALPTITNSISGEISAFTEPTDSTLWEHYEDNQLTSIRLFQYASDADGLPITLDTNNDRYGTHLEIDIFEMPPNFVFIFDLQSGWMGNNYRYFHATEFDNDVLLFQTYQPCNTCQTYAKIIKLCRSSICNDEIIFDTLQVEWSTYSQIRISHKTSILFARQFNEELSPVQQYQLLQTWHDKQSTYQYSHPNTVPADHWQLVQRFISGSLFLHTLESQTPTPLRLVFNRKHRNVANDDLARRSVAVDDIQVVPVLTEELSWRCSLGDEIFTNTETPNGICTVLYVPTAHQLSRLGLESVLSDFDEESWQRLHVTVQVAAMAKPITTPLHYRVYVRQIGQDLGFSDQNSDRVRDIGCRLTIPTDGLGQCHLVVPAGMALTNNNRWVGLTVVPDPNSPSGQTNDTDTTLLDTLSFQALILPYTQMFECEGNHYWSETHQTCRPCHANNTAMECPLDTFVRGCRALMDFTNPNIQLCEPCPSRPDNASDIYSWTDTCEFQCMNGTFYDSDSNACLPCTEHLKNTCRNIAGRKWVQCTPVTNEQCESCPDDLLQNEEHVAWEHGECNKRCKHGYYRSLPDLFCRPRKTLESDVPPAPTGAEFTRLTRSTYFSDAARVPCSK